MLRTLILECSLPVQAANALNAESGRVYSRTMAAHFRRPTAQDAASKADAGTTRYADERPLLPRSSRYIAQQGYADAVRSAHKNHRQGVPRGTPQRPKSYRTTVWRGPAIQLADGSLRLSRAWNMASIRVPLPADLAELAQADFREVRLVWNSSQQQHYWQVVVDERRQAVFGQRIAAVDLGTAYPATITDGEVAVVFDVTQLKSPQRQAERQIERIRQAVRTQRPGSREARRLRRVERSLGGRQAIQVSPLERLVSRAVVQWAVENGVGTLVVGDADGLTHADGSLPAAKLNKGPESVQTRIMRYLAALARALGIVVRFVDEALTSQTCPSCHQRNRAHGRRYKCAICGFQGHRDVVGSSNILSRYLYGDLGQVWPGRTQICRPDAIA